MALREAGERHHDNLGEGMKLSDVAAGHTMQVKERHYEKVGEDFELVHESYRNPVFVEGGRFIKIWKLDWRSMKWAQSTFSCNTRKESITKTGATFLYYEKR